MTLTTGRSASPKPSSASFCDSLGASIATKGCMLGCRHVSKSSYRSDSPASLEPERSSMARTP
eukprot:6681962-Alexandrium_andersonii.AAC.1